MVKKWESISNSFIKKRTKYNDENTPSSIKPKGIFDGISMIGFTLVKFIILCVKWGFILFAGILVLLIVIQMFIPGGSPLLNKYVIGPISDTGVWNLFYNNFLVRIPQLATQEGQAKIIEETRWKSTIDENANENSGLQILEFRTDKEVIYPKDKNLIVTANGIISTKEPATIEFSCLTEDNQFGKISDENTEVLTITTEPNTIKRFSINCIYNEESNPDLFTFNEKTKTRNVKFRGLYTLISESYIPIYFVEQNTIDEIIDKINQEEIDKEKKSEKTLSSEEIITKVNEELFMGVDDEKGKLDKNTGEVKSQSGGGPLRVIPQVFDFQPYTEEGSVGLNGKYNLEVKFDENKDWTEGSLEEIEEFYILTTDEISIESKEFTESSREDEYNVYVASDSFIQGLNNICKSGQKTVFKKILDIIDEKCWRSGDVRAVVPFSIKSPGNVVDKTFIRTKTKYKYNDEKSKSIIFVDNLA